LREEYATLFGAASDADVTLRRRRALNAAQATRFLDAVRTAVNAREQRELDGLRAAKARELGLPPAGVKLDHWDIAYCTERVKRERSSVDQEALRPCFAPQESLAFVMRLIEKMMGVKYTRVEGASLWHPDVVHDNLSATRHSSQTNVLRDFVEAPSQMLEAWVYDRHVLGVMREVCPACKPVPDELLAKAVVAERYGKGVQYARQQLQASFDLGLHGPDAPEPMALRARMEGNTLLGQAPPQDLVRSFLGRDSSSKAFIADLKR
jgi:Zn-dependent oligopeptidase